MFCGKEFKNILRDCGNTEDGGKFLYIGLFNTGNNLIYLEGDYCFHVEVSFEKLQKAVKEAAERKDDYLCITPINKNSSENTVFVELCLREDGAGLSNEIVFILCNGAKCSRVAVNWENLNGYLDSKL